MNQAWVGMGVGAACMVAVACGADGELAKQMLEDAGEALVDAGRMLVDAGGGAGGGAQAQGGGETHEVQCTDALVRTVVQGGVTTRSITRVAELAVSTTGVTGVDVVICGKEGSAPAETYCPTGATCSGTSNMTSGDCATVAANIDPNKIRAWCGRYDTVNGVAQSTGERWKTARITVRR